VGGDFAESESLPAAEVMGARLPPPQVRFALEERDIESTPDIAQYVHALYQEDCL
jgi:hypothetical protein